MEVTVDDIIAKIRTWRFNELNVKDLMRIAVKPHTLKHVRLYTSHRFGYFACLLIL